MKKLTKAQSRDIRAIAAQKDEDIDFSDAPPVLDWRGPQTGKSYRPPKSPVTLRLDADVIAWLKSAGRRLSNQSQRAASPHAMHHLTRAKAPAGRSQKRHKHSGKKHSA
jgi:uncharacterized protein (DUF4415 family)